MMRNYNFFFYLVALLSCLCFVSADEDEERDESKKGVAFGLVIAAGMSTTIGAAFVFCDAAVKRENYKFLGGALGFAGGIMIYISLVEILQGSFDEFTEVFEDEKEEETAGRRLDGGGENATALTLGTLMFFVGVLIIYLLDFIVHRIFKAAGSPLESHAIISDARNSIKEVQDGEEDAEVAEDKENDDQTEEVSEALRLHLRKMGIVTAIALGLHNLPEGFATYIGALKDTELGMSLAFAIGIHNIPEGLCVAIPIFYATGSRWQGFWVAFASGLAEIVGGIIAEIVVGDEEPATFGVVFGIVAGMMTCIVLRELMPTALRYDPNDKYVTNCLFIGAAVMAFSIILFNI